MPKFFSYSASVSQRWMAFICKLFSSDVTKSKLLHFYIHSLLGVTQKNVIFHEGFLQQMRPNPQFPAYLITFPEEILNGKLLFLCSDRIVISQTRLWKHRKQGSLNQSLYYSCVLANTVHFEKTKALFVQQCFLINSHYYVILFILHKTRAKK